MRQGHVDPQRLSQLYNFGSPTAYIVAWRDIYIFVGFSALFYFISLGYQAFLTYSPVVKSQARTILFGSLLAFGPVVFWLLYTSAVGFTNPHSEVNGV